MQMLKKIIVINVSALLLLSSTCIKPTADSSYTQVFEAIKHNPKAENAYNNYCMKLITKSPYTALEQAEIILSTPSLNRNEQKNIALCVSSHLHPLLYPYTAQTVRNTNPTVETFAQNLLSQVKLKNNIIDKILRIKRNKLNARYILNNHLFSPAEKTLLAEHFSMLIFSSLIDECTTTFTRSEFIDDFTTFNDVGELEKQAYSKLIAIQETLLKKSLAAISNTERREKQKHTFAEILTLQRSNIFTDDLDRLDEMEKLIYKSRLEDITKRL